MKVNGKLFWSPSEANLLLETSNPYEIFTVTEIRLFTRNTNEITAVFIISHRTNWTVSICLLSGIVLQEEKRLLFTVILSKRRLAYHLGRATLKLFMFSELSNQL